MILKQGAHDGRVAWIGGSDIVVALFQSSPGGSKLLDLGDPTLWILVVRPKVRMIGNCCESADTSDGVGSSAASSESWRQPRYEPLELLRGHVCCFQTRSVGMIHDELADLWKDRGYMLRYGYVS